MLRIVLALLSTTLFLTSCFTGTDVFDQVFVIDPVVTVSATNVVLGDFVKVHVSSSFYLLPQSRIPAVSADVQLGICLQPDWLAIDDGVTPTSDNCWDPELFGTDAYFEPSDDFTLAPAQSASVTMLTTIERGQTIDIEHTFYIAAERAGTIKLLGILYAHPNQSWGTSICVADCGSVTWE